MHSMKKENEVIAVIGLGYVGLPLAIEFGKLRNVIGYDILKNRIKELSRRFDSTLEISEDEFKAAKFLRFTNNCQDLSRANVYVITVPTPVDASNRPDMTALRESTELIAKFLKKGDIVVYESTVYPGATEEFCVPILEKISSLIYKKDFNCGYSPERINPGDKTRKISTIKKVVSGSNRKTADILMTLYGEIISAGLHRASSIKVAEASKVLENTQRDVNIALINEFSLIFDKLGIDTKEVLDAAKTKWNFLDFSPGLVGGHCIGVDPYYIAYKSEVAGYHPELINASRKVNNKMTDYIANKLIDLMIGKSINISKSKILVLGITFKENCSDVRNSKTLELISKLKAKGITVDAHDPWVAEVDANIQMYDWPIHKKYDAVILSVPHAKILEYGIKRIKGIMKDKSVLYDLKGALFKGESDARL